MVESGKSTAAAISGVASKLRFESYSSPLPFSSVGSEISHDKRRKVQDRMIFVRKIFENDDAMTFYMQKQH